MSRLRLPWTVTVLTRRTFTLKISSIAALTWCFVARGSTSNAYCACAVCETDFSVTTGRMTTLLDSGTAHLRQRFVRVLRDEHAVVREHAVHRHLAVADDGQASEIAAGPHDRAGAFVAARVDDEQHRRTRFR